MEGKMQNFGDIMGQVRSMQERMTKIQEELSRRTVTATSGGGMVTVVCTGKQEIVSISVEKAVIDPEEPEMLQDLVLTAVNESLRLSRDMMAQEMSALTGGMNIPGLSF